MGKNSLEWGETLRETLTNIEYFVDFKNILPYESFNYKCVSWVKVNGSFYKPNMIIIINKKDCKFAKIKYVVKSESCDILFICKNLKTVQFNVHFYAYEVTEGI